MTTRVLLVVPDAECPPGRLGERLTASGLELDLCRPYAGDQVADPLGYAALVVLGGTMGANDDAEYPWLGTVKDALATAVEAGLPTLGVCLGHQLLAVACGGTVAPNPSGTTAGLRPVRVTDHVDDPLHAGLPSDAVAIHWNNDVVHASPDSMVLARTDDDHPQVLRIGPRAWGVQFHPEVTPDVVAGWAAHSVDRGEISTDDAEQRLAEIRRADDHLRRTWEKWADRLVTVIISHRDRVGASRSAAG